MPMMWNAEADAKLMATVLQVCDVKLSQQQYDTAAKVMGCTPKAIMHRMGKIRSAGKQGDQDGDDNNAGGEGTTASKPAKKTVKAAAAGGNKKKTTGAGGKKKQAARTPSPDGDDEEQAGGNLTPPPSNRPKRGGAKRNYAQLAGEEGSEEEAEEGEDGLSKKVKIEVGEDIGEGLRQVNEDEQDGEAELDGAGFFS